MFTKSDSILLAWRGLIDGHKPHNVSARPVCFQVPSQLKSCSGALFSTVELNGTGAEVVALPCLTHAAFASFDSNKETGRRRSQVSKVLSRPLSSSFCNIFNQKT